MVQDLLYPTLDLAAGAWMISGGMRCRPIAKKRRLRSVWATHSASAGTAIGSKLSVSLRVGSGAKSVIDLTTVVVYTDMVKSGLYPQPRRHGQPSCPTEFDPAGFSDHFPVVTVLRAV